MISGGQRPRNPKAVKIGSILTARKSCLKILGILKPFESFKVEISRDVANLKQLQLSRRRIAGAFQDFRKSETQERKESAGCKDFEGSKDFKDS